MEPDSSQASCSREASQAPVERQSTFRAALPQSMPGFSPSGNLQVWPQRIHLTPAEKEKRQRHIQEEGERFFAYLLEHRGALSCPLQKTIFVDPVAAADGYTYERAAITAWLAHSDTSPLTGAKLADRTLVNNQFLQDVACCLRLGIKARVAGMSRN